MMLDSVLFVMLGFLLIGTGFVTGYIVRRAQSLSEKAKTEES